MKTIPMGIPERGVPMNRTATPGGTVGGRQDQNANQAPSDGSRGGFTLIELLVVISIMVLLASLTVSVLHGVAITKYRNVARAELGEIQTALERYKDQYGTYPPSNANPLGTYTTWPLTNSLFPPLYYELCGVTNNPKVNAFVTMDTLASMNINDVRKAFGMSGFVNCSRGSGDEGTPARNFLSGLKANRIASVSDNGVWVTNLVTSVGGPDSKYTPLGAANANPVRYLFPGVNNPKGYDLWVELVISGKTNLICNWSGAVIINSGLP
ncbi:MAG: type II secretion system protein [Verrucomicrobiae bacterium]|nr:type II secretion system protein [Verrucomicrobiae bacterium]